jgi:hypothetical protein
LKYALILLYLILIAFTTHGNNFKATSSESGFRDTIQNSKYFSYRASLHYGALIGYKDNQPPLIFTNPYGIELAFTQLSAGKKNWETLYNFPAVVYSLAYYNYGVPHDYGQAFAGTVSYDFNLLRKNKKRLWLTAGLGLVYSTRKFDSNENPFNKSISTDISYVLQGSIRYDFEINERFQLSPSFSFRHFSNATLGIPNNGMNFPLIGLGVTYLPKSYIFPERM